MIPYQVTTHLVEVVHASLEEHSVLSAPAATLWETDESVKSCPVCAVKFGFTTRRHHCRVCGKIFCDADCNIMIPVALPDQEPTLKRSCLPCLLQFNLNISKNPMLSYFISKKNNKIFIHRWIPDSHPKGVLIISHSLTEHGGCYKDFAKFMVQSGFAVYAIDHWGHGKSKTMDSDYFTSYHDLVDDLLLFINIKKAHHPDLPMFLLGHGFGASLILKVVLDTPAPLKLAGIILNAPFINEKMPKLTGGATPIAAVLFPFMEMVHQLQLLVFNTFRGTSQLCFLES